MKDNIKVMIYFGIFIVLMVFAYIWYNKLVEKENISKEDIVEKNEEKIKLQKFELYLENGDTISSDEFIGKPLVINVWTSWCGYCDVEMPYFNELYLKEKDNVTFIMINATGDRDTKENAKKYIQESGYSFDIYYDYKLEAITALGIYSYPTTIFVDKNGYIDSTNVGLITKEILQDKINKLKEE